MNSLCRAACRILFVVVAATGSLTLSGCPDSRSPSAEPTAAAAIPPLALLVVEDPPLGKAIAREWLGRTEEKLTVRDITLAEVAGASRLPGDAVIFPAAMIGQLAERGLIAPLEPAALEDSEFEYRDIFDQIRLREMRWGGKTVATPLGSPQLLLAYRVDVFEKRRAIQKRRQSNLWPMAGPVNYCWPAPQRMPCTAIRFRPCFDSTR
jgi:hypothetical protein